PCNSPCVWRPRRIEKNQAWVSVGRHLSLLRAIDCGLPDIRHPVCNGTVDQLATVNRPLKILSLQKVVWQLSEAAKRDAIGRDRSGISTGVVYYPEIACAFHVTQKGYLFTVG